MNQLKRSRRFLLLAGLWLGAGTLVSAGFQTASHEVAPGAVTQGGETATVFTSHRLTSSVGELAGPDVFSTSHRVGTGFGTLITRPGAVADLNVVAKSSGAITVSWSAPGYSGVVGHLPAGTTYFIRASTDPAEAWTFSSAQVAVATQAVAPGAWQSASVPGLLANTTYYLRIWTAVAGDMSPLSNGTTAMTLAVPAASLAQTFLEVNSSSVTAAWAAAPAAGYVLEASRFADFSSLILSSRTMNVALSTLTITNMSSDTLYYFRVGTLNGAGDLTYAALGSVQTLTSTDEQGPGAVADLAATAVAADGMRLDWTAPADPTDVPLNGRYLIQHSTWSGVSWSTASSQVVISTSGVNAGAPQSALVEGLAPNATHFFRVWTADLRPNYAPASNQTSRATLALPLADSAFAGLHLSSASVGWTPVAAGGYRLEASTAPTFTGTVASSQTASLTASTLTVTGLAANTTYYFRAGSINIASQVNWTTLAAATLATAPSAIAPDFLAASTGSVTARWAARPAAPQAATAEGYRLEASPAGFAEGTVLSSASASVAQSTLTVSGLAPNTVYAFRAGSLNWNGAPSFTSLSSTATLAGTVSPSLVEMFASSATFAWTAPEGGAAGGYRLVAALNAGFTGVLSSSSTTNAGLTTLTVSSLTANTTYHFRVASLNATGGLNFSDAQSLSTKALPVNRIAPDHLAVSATSVTARWAAQAGRGYRLEASTSDFSGGVVLSSQTALVAASTLTLSGLDVNATYFFRVGTLNWSGDANFVALDSTATLANAPLPSAATFAAVHVTSAAAQWLDNGNPAGTTYELQLSTAPDFTGTLHASQAPSAAAGVTGLAPNTTYFARARALNRLNAPSAFTLLASTVTRAATPEAGGAPFSPVHATSATVTFLSGTPANPAGTRYVVELDDDAGFSSPVSSNTANLGAAFTGLTPNTSYFARARALNALNQPTAFADAGSTVTLAVPPGVDATTYSGLAHDGFALQWTSGTGGVFNAGGTLYQAEASESPTFAGGITRIETTDLSTTFIGLNSGTAYHARVRAVNAAGVATAYTTYGTTTTFQSSKPTFPAGTFEVTDADGAWIDGTLYTNTLTPGVRTVVRSAFSPGLVVATTSAHLALWPMNDGSGAVARDMSRAANDLALVNAPAWTGGQIGGALSFDGATEYGVSPNLNPWRSDAANSQWSVALWFRTVLSRGFLFQTAAGNTPGQGTYDGEISWYDSTGNLAFELNRNNNRRYIQAAGSYADGQWHFVTATVDAVGMKLYVDGELVASGTEATAATARTYTSAYAWVGAATTQGATMGGGDFQHFPGDIDDVLLVGRALSGSDIADLYALGLTHRIGMGAPQVEISTGSGAPGTFVRLSTTAIAITGTDGTTTDQTFTASALPPLVETAFPAADTNRVAFIASAVDAKQTASFHTVLVDTTPPAASAIDLLTVASSTTVNAAWIATTDALSGLAAAAYRVDASTDAGFGGAQTSGWTAETSHAFSALAPNTTYHVRVSAHDAAGNVAVSASTSAVTFAAPLSGAAFVSVTTGSVSARWNAAAGNGYRLEASTTGFNGTGTVHSTATASVSASTLTIAGLPSNTAHQFRVAAINWAGAATYVTVGSTATLAFPPVAPSTASVHVSSMTLAWQPPEGGAAGFRVEASTAANFTGALFTSAGFAVTGLTSNTTYHLRVAALNEDGAPNVALVGAQATLANVPAAPAVTAVHVASATLSWLPPAGGASGFEVQASTAADFSGTVISSATGDGAATSLVALPLGSDATYYFRVASLNRSGDANFAAAGSTKTLVSIDLTAPAAVADLSLSTSTSGSLLVRWTAPSDPTNAPLNGQYALQHSTWSGVAWSTTAAQVFIATTNVSAGAPQQAEITGLDANTTHFVRLWTSDPKPNWSPASNLPSEMTLSLIPADLGFVAVASAALRADWTALAAAPPALSASSYRLEASTAADFTGDLAVAASSDMAESALTVNNLLANTTHHVRVASLNGKNVPNFSGALSTSTLAALAARIAPDHTSVQLTSVTARWAAQAGRGYRLEASSTNFSGGAVLSSQTASVALSTLTVSGLSLNTTYFFRVGTLNWNGAANYTTLDATSTLADVPLATAPTFAEVHVSSATAQWLGNGNPANTRYHLDLSTASDFTGALFGAATTATSGTVTGLSPNTTYFARSRSFNRLNLASTYVLLGSTVTQASVPGAAGAPHSSVATTSLTINFTAGAPANPAGTRYVVELSADPSFATAASSDTANLNAAFTGLSPNTTYFARARSINALGRASAYLDIVSTTTVAVAPGTAAPPFADVSYDGFTLNWTSGSAVSGFNGAGTVYQAQLATDAGFTVIAQETATTDLASGFSGLTSGTNYYARVRALRHGGEATAWTTYGFTTTLQSSKPSFLAGTFEVTDAAGQWIDGTRYTNSLTPLIRAQVQSAFLPGLSVSTTTDHVALWHLDETGGTAAFDASRNGRNLTLTNGPVRTDGRFARGADFDGSNDFAVSANLNPWRSDAANNEWSVALWFRSTLGRGYLFQAASQNTTGGATYDAEISWSDTTGTLSFVVNQGTTRRTISAASSYADGQWHFVTAVLNTAGMTLYVDGEQRATGNLVTAGTARTYAAAYAWLGGATAQGAGTGGGSFQYFPGDIDEVLIAGEAFSAAQIRDLYDLGNTRGITMGAPQVEISTQSGGNFTWVRVSTAANNITGTAGTTASQTFTSSLSAVGMSLIETAAPGADTNQAAFIASSLDANQTTAFFTILVDTTAPAGASVTGVTDVSSFSVTTAWSAGSDALSGLPAAAYNLRASSSAVFAGEQATGWTSDTSAAFGALLPNTTYHLRLHARDNAGNASSADASTVTLAGLPASPAVAAVYGTSVTVAWSAPAGGASGYALHASTAADFSGTLYSSVTANGALTALAVPGLASNTTYYFRAGSLNRIGAPNFAPALIQMTADIVPPSAVADLAAGPGDAGREIRLGWTAPGDNGATGALENAAFVVQYTTDTAFAAGAAWSPDAAQPGHVSRVTLSTGGVQPGEPRSFAFSGLTGGATYHFRLWTRDDAGNHSPISNGATTYATPTNLSVELSTDTLALGSLTPGSTVVYSSSITVRNTGNVTTRFRILVVNPADWSATGSGAGVDTFRLTGLFRAAAPQASDFDPSSDAILTTEGTASSTRFARDADADAGKGFDVAPGEERGFWIRIEMPPISSTTEPQVIRLTATASE